MLSPDAILVRAINSNIDPKRGLTLVKAKRISASYRAHNGDTFLLAAIANNRIAIAIRLTKEYPELCNICNIMNPDDIRCPLIMAIERKYNDVAIAIIKVLQLTPKHLRVLCNDAYYMACILLMHDVVSALFESGCLDYAYVYPHDDTILTLACRYDMPNIAISIIDSGYSNIGHVNRKKSTALIYACRYSSVELVRKLAETGNSRPDQVDQFYWTALMYSCLRKSHDMFIAIWNTGGADLSRIEYDRGSVLYYAILAGMFDAVKLIIAYNVEFVNVIRNDMPLLSYIIANAPNRDLCYRMMMEVLRTGVVDISMYRNYTHYYSNSNNDDAYIRRRPVSLCVIRKIFELVRNEKYCDYEYRGYNEYDGEFRYDMVNQNGPTQMRGSDMVSITAGDAILLKLSDGSINMDHPIMKRLPTLRDVINVLVHYDVYAPVLREIYYDTMHIEITI